MKTPDIGTKVYVAALWIKDGREQTFEVKAVVKARQFAGSTKSLKLNDKPIGERWMLAKVGVELDGTLYGTLPYLPERVFGTRKEAGESLRQRGEQLALQILTAVKKPNQESEAAQ